MSPPLYLHIPRPGLLLRIRRIFCRHTVVTIWRCHASLWRDMHARVAWTDRYGVHNYVRCAKCGAILDGSQTTERLYDSREAT